MAVSIGKFFFGRVIKLGTLDKDKFIEALSLSKGYETSKYKWLITDSFHNKENEFEYFYGKLSKYSPEGETLIIDEDTKKTKEDITQNLAIASAPFIFIPEFSGIVYLKVSNQIDEEAFKGRIRSIVVSYFNNFFVDVGISDIVETFKFEEKIKSFDQINRIECDIYQPNPLYGDIWKHLFDYLKNRNSKELKIVEESKSEGGISTNLNNKNNSANRIVLNVLSLADAAIYMAIDGYGKGKVKGLINGKEKEFKTSQNVLFLNAEKNIEHKELARLVYNELAKLNSERDLKH